MIFSGSALAVLLIALQTGTTPVRSPAPDTTKPVWQIDAGHSDISFRIRHFMSRVRGTFNQWSGTITGEESNWAEASVDITIETASIDTRNERRDNDLRSPNFFDVTTHPTITFKSTRVEVQGEELRISGDLTMHGVTRPVILEGRFLGSTTSTQGRARVGFEASTTINRTDFGVSWNRVVEGSGVMLGDEVEIEIAVEATRQPPQT
jgi:polyisoprenoid-binding protein YceI